MVDMIDKPPHLKPTCSVCGGSDVQLDAWVRWNEASQGFDVDPDEVFDANGYCADCDGPASIEWVAIPKPPGKTIEVLVKATGARMVVFHDIPPNLVAGAVHMLMRMTEPNLVRVEIYDTPSEHEEAGHA